MSESAIQPTDEFDLNVEDFSGETIDLEGFEGFK
jgi:hypothetical protein